MKIIVTGKIPAPQQPWWVGKRIKCEYCGSIFELEESDKPFCGGERVLTGRQFVQIPCPTCENTVSLIKTAYH